MNRKMQGFLLSIGLDDVERFDMDFTLVAKDEYTPDLVNMMIEKESLWSYDLLDEFIMGLDKIQYKISIRFFYPNCSLTSKDVFELLDRWYPRNYFMPIRFQADTYNPNRLDLVYSSESERDLNMPRIAEFKGLLKFINYTMAIDQSVDPERARRLAADALYASRHPIIEEEEEEVLEETPAGESSALEPSSNDPVNEETPEEETEPEEAETLTEETEDYSAEEPIEEADANESEAENEDEEPSDEEGEAYYSAEDSLPEEKLEEDPKEVLEEEIDEEDVEPEPSLPGDEIDSEEYEELEESSEEPAEELEEFEEMEESNELEEPEEERLEEIEVFPASEQDIASMESEGSKS